MTGRLILPVPHASKRRAKPSPKERREGGRPTCAGLHAERVSGDLHSAVGLEDDEPRGQRVQGLGGCGGLWRWVAAHAAFLRTWRREHQAERSGRGGRAGRSRAGRLLPAFLASRGCRSGVGRGCRPVGCLHAVPAFWAESHTIVSREAALTSLRVSADESSPHGRVSAMQIC